MMNNNNNSSPVDETATSTANIIMNDDPTTNSNSVVAAGGTGGLVNETKENNHGNKNKNDQLVVLRWVNLVAFVVNVVVTYGVGVAGLLGLKPNTDVSNQYPTLITPSGYAFAIWGIIFLLQGVWVVQQFIYPYIIHHQPLSYTDQIVAVQMHYALVVLAQVLWTLAFSNEWIVASAVLMMVLLTNLAVIVFRQLNQQQSGAVFAASSTKRPWYCDLLTKVPFHLHFGWILVASVVNLNVALTTLTQSTAVLFYVGAVGGLVLLVLATLFIIFRAGFYGVVPAVAVWGLIAVYIAGDDPSTIIASDFTSRQRSLVQYGALGSAVLIGTMAVVRGLWKLSVAPSLPSSCWGRQPARQPGPDAVVNDA